MSNKIKYRELCRLEKSIPIFIQDWWLDSVCGEDGWEVVIIEKNGQIIAALPYVFKNNRTFKTIINPPLTQNCGPWLKVGTGKKNRLLSTEYRLLSELYEQLPSHDYYCVNWSHLYKNWLPLMWLGYSQTTCYTYVIEDLSDLNEVFGNFSSSYRNKIRKASELVHVSKGMHIDDFYMINKRTFDRQSVKMPYSCPFIERHDSILADKNRREIFQAVDEMGNTHSALYLTWDDVSSYVHMVGEDPRYRSSGAGILLIWEAIKFTREVLNLNRFDFEGSMLPNVEKVRRDCGAVPVSYFRIEKFNNTLYQLLKGIRSKLC